ncbi:MAG: transcriptional regulator of heat shock response [Cryomorphaceae bacterium]|jgi:transcriptional regulator of heat shock response
MNGEHLKELGWAFSVFQNVTLGDLTAMTRFPRKKKKKVNMRWIIILSLGLVVMASCGDSARVDNRTIKEAATIHEEILTRHDSIYTALTNEKKRISAELEAGISRQKKKSAYESMIRSIDKSFRALSSWEESVVAVPGFEHKHTGEHHHSHDPMKEEIAASMSDKEILALQRALRSRLGEVSTQIRGLLLTIESYDQNG